MTEPTLLCVRVFTCESLLGRQKLVREVTVNIVCPNRLPDLLPKTREIRSSEQGNLVRSLLEPRIRKLYRVLLIRNTKVSQGIYTGEERSTLGGRGQNWSVQSPERWGGSSSKEKRTET